LLFKTSLFLYCLSQAGNANFFDQNPLTEADFDSVDTYSALAAASDAAIEKAAGNDANARDGGDSSSSESEDAEQSEEAASTDESSDDEAETADSSHVDSANERNDNTASPRAHGSPATRSSTQSASSSRRQAAARSPIDTSVSPAVKAAIVQETKIPSPAKSPPRSRSPALLSPAPTKSPAAAPSSAVRETYESLRANFQLDPDTETVGMSSVAFVICLVRWVLQMPCLFVVFVVLCRWQVLGSVSRARAVRKTGPNL